MTPTHHNQFEPLLRARDVQRIFNVAVRTIYSWHDRGFLRAVVLPAGAMRWRRADVDALIASGLGEQPQEGGAQ